MKDLIERETVIDILRFIKMPIKDTDNEAQRMIIACINEGIETSIKALKTLPSAQPEVLACGEGELSAQPEIIRCKDCREYRRYIDTDITFCDLTEVEVKECDFCSHAKRREE